MPKCSAQTVQPCTPERQIQRQAAYPPPISSWGFPRRIEGPEWERIKANVFPRALFADLTDPVDLPQ